MLPLLDGLSSLPTYLRLSDCRSSGVGLLLSLHTLPAAFRHKLSSMTGFFYRRPVLRSQRTLTF